MYARDHALIATPVGMIRVDGDDERLHAIAIEPGSAPECRGHATEVVKAADQLRQYFTGERTAFALRLIAAATSRGQVLRDAMIAVSYGDTTTYGALSTAITSSARALGQACARNPFPIVVPCHRILSRSGPQNYSAGDGPATKRWLLDHERRHA